MAWQRRNLGQVVCFDTFNIPEINLSEGPLRRKPCFFLQNSHSLEMFQNVEILQHVTSLRNMHTLYIYI